MAEIIYVVCPMCGLNRPLEKKGTNAIARGLPIKEIKGRIRFDQIDLESGYILQIRERPSGPERIQRFRRGGGPGFPFLRGETLRDMKSNPIYKDLIDQIKETAENILSILS
jgi:hypothetical protein